MIIKINCFRFINESLLLMGKAAQGICDEAYFAYVEEAIPRRTQPIGKRGHLEIENLAAAD
jgi:hypothetical protein